MKTPVIGQKKVCLGGQSLTWSGGLQTVKHHKNHAGSLTHRVLLPEHLNKNSHRQLSRLVVLHRTAPVHCFTALVQGTGPMVSLVQGTGPMVQGTGSMVHCTGSLLHHIVPVVHVTGSVVQCNGSMISLV